MHELIEKGLVTEIRGPQSISYVLEEDGLFNLSEYKIIHNQQTTAFVDFAKYTYNGKDKLTYFTEEYVSLKSIVSSIEVYPFVSIVANILGCINDTVHNGYLDAAALNLEFNRIFVNPNTLDVKLIYLPVNGRHSGGTVVKNTSALEELRTNLVKLIYSTPSLISPKTREICGWLSDGLMSLDDVHSRIRTGGTQGSKRTRVDKILVLSALNTSAKYELAVNKASYTIGRNAAEVDGHIGFNPAVSGIHCKIKKSGACFTVEDLNSRNGTFVNKVKVAAGNSAMLKEGDILRISNTDFKVSIREG